MIAGQEIGNFLALHDCIQCVRVMAPAPDLLQYRKLAEIIRVCLNRHKIMGLTSFSHCTEWPACCLLDALQGDAPPSWTEKADTAASRQGVASGVHVLYQQQQYQAPSTFLSSTHAAVFGKPVTSPRQPAWKAVCEHRYEPRQTIVLPNCPSMQKLPLEIRTGQRDIRYSAVPVAVQRYNEWHFRPKRDLLLYNVQAMIDVAQGKSRKRPASACKRPAAKRTKS